MTQGLTERVVCGVEWLDGGLRWGGCGAAYAFLETVAGYDEAFPRADAGQAGRHGGVAAEGFFDLGGGLGLVRSSHKYENFSWSREVDLHFTGQTKGNGCDSPFRDDTL